MFTATLAVYNVKCNLGSNSRIGLLHRIPQGLCSCFQHDNSRPGLRIGAKRELLQPRFKPDYSPSIRKYVKSQIRSGSATPDCAEKQWLHGWNHRPTFSGPVDIGYSVRVNFTGPEADGLPDSPQNPGQTPQNPPGREALSG